MSQAGFVSLYNQFTSTSSNTSMTSHYQVCLQDQVNDIVIDSTGTSGKESDTDSMSSIRYFIHIQLVELNFSN